VLSPWWTETQGVLPPYFSVLLPGVDIDPRVPQNVARNF